MEAFDKFHNVIKTLISPDGCPWDKVQTPESMKKYLVEETFEALEAIDSGDKEHAKEELGDVILNACMTCCIYEKQGDFSLEDVIETVTQKLIRRHPHVFPESEGAAFAEGNGSTFEQLNVQWDRIKEKMEGHKVKKTSQEKYADLVEAVKKLAPLFDVK